MNPNKKSKVSKSLTIYKKAKKLIPGNTQLISRRSNQFAHGHSPIYGQNSKGSYFTDIDGNVFLDWVNAFSAIILGHRNNNVDTAVKKQIDNGSIFTINSPLEIELAELLCEIIPSSQMVKYTKGGGEACALGIRIARGVTNKDKILFSGYHGWHDWYQSANFLSNPNDGEYPFAGIEAIGVPKVLKGTSIPFSYGDISNLEKLIIENKNEIAAIIMEPMRSDYPPNNYLQKIRKISKDNNIILIFDEVTSGWRISVGGAQKALGVTPDMSIFSKAMSNGYPMGAVVGSKDVMEPASRMFVSSSYWSDNIGISATISTINTLLSQNSEIWFKDFGKEFKSTISKICEDSGIAIQCKGAESSPYISFDSIDEYDTKTIKTLCIQEMAKRGIHTNLTFHPSMTHTIKDINKTADALYESLKIVKEAMESNIENFLDSPISEDPFKRLVK